jgi:hypothetical protein
MIAHDTDAVVTVFADKFAKSWPRNATGKAGALEPVSWALDSVYPTDAHFVAYESPDGRRLGREAIDRLEVIRMHVLVFDIDAPKADKGGGQASLEWRTKMRELVEALAKDHPNPCYYETRGGARIVYRLPKPYKITDHAHAARWSYAYSVAVEYLKQRYSIEADPACIDWQRMYRLPDTVRDGERQQWYTWGSPHDIGVFRAENVPSKAIAMARWHGKAFKNATKETHDFTPDPGAGADGVLPALCRSKGFIVRAQPGDGNGWFIRCPNEAQHSSGRTGDTSTILYPAARGETWGSIHCKHSHCGNMQVKDWLEFFTQTEIDEAKLTNGIQPDYTRESALADLDKWRAAKNVK